MVSKDKLSKKIIKNRTLMSRHKYILKKYADVFKALEEYDKTKELPFDRKRIDITLSVATINKLRALSKETGKPVSHIIEECVNKRKKNLYS